MSINSRIRNFIESNLILNQDEEMMLMDDTNIFEAGFVNSLFAMKLLNFVETEFNIEVANDEIDISHFSSIENIEQLINSKLN